MYSQELMLAQLAKFKVDKNVTIGDLLLYNIKEVEFSSDTVSDQSVANLFGIS